VAPFCHHLLERPVDLRVCNNKIFAGLVPRLRTSANRCRGEDPTYIWPPERHLSWAYIIKRLVLKDGRPRPAHLQTNFDLLRPFLAYERAASFYAQEIVSERKFANFHTVSSFNALALLMMMDEPPQSKYTHSSAALAICTIFLGFA